MAKNDLTQARELIKKCRETEDPCLDLGRCGITDLNALPELFECRHLETLILSNNWWSLEKKDTVEEKNTSRNKGAFNELDSIPTEIAKLDNLKTLILSGISTNKLQTSDISFLEKLVNLQALDLSENEIPDMRVLENLTGLQFLRLNSNQITDIRVLENLTELQRLYLYDNNISDISALEGMKKLKGLYIGTNQISDISSLKKLTELEDLYLDGNQISDISFLENLTGLQSLNLGRNALKEIPLSNFTLDMEIDLEEYVGRGSGLRLGDNPIESPPLEILKQGRQSVLDWFEATKKKLDEIKIIIIGDPKAGKTSLLRRLKDGSFSKDEAQTDGVNIVDIEFGTCEPFKDQTSLHGITGHFWDFGGQEIMNATHQFFLTKRAVYILLLDARKDKNVSDHIRQWIRQMKTTGGDSSLIIVANQIDVNRGFGFENEYELQQEFPQIKSFIKASCDTEENIGLIKKTLEELIPEAEFFNTKIDERWIELKDKLEEGTKEKFFLNETRFLSACKEVKLTKKREQLNAIKFLHDLGLVLHFEELDLQEYYVLDPYWITYGVYQILTSTYAGKMNGKVDMEKLEFIVNEEEEKKERYEPENFRKLTYSHNERRFLVDILHQFKLCFRLPGGKHFIVPDLLGTNEPVEITGPVRDAGESIQFVYEYEYLPKSTMPRIMVEAHNIIVNMWRTGCVLQSNGCNALVTNYQSRLYVAVVGDHKKKREFMAVIRHLIDRINEELSDRPTMLIPLPGTKEFADYEELLDRERDGELLFTLYKPTKIKFEISKLLEGVPSRDEIREISKKIDEVLANQVDIKNALDSHYKYLIDLPESEKINDDILGAIKEMNAEQSAAIVEDIMQSINDTFDACKGELDNRLEEIYSDLKKTDDVQMKLKLSVPIINLLGVNLETEFDMKSWATKMYEKHEMKLFKMMGYL